MADRRQVLRYGALAVAAPAIAAAVPAAPAVAAPTWAPTWAGPAGPATRRGRKHIVVGHRGASGYRPEHTLASYELAARLGADFIEPDLVSTKDGVLVCRHEPEIGGTTDVASHPEFADRRRTVLLDGVSVTGWFTHDFTLAELRTLRATERIPAVRQRNTLYNGLFPVPTFNEVLALRTRLSRELGREIGVFPETKHPTYFRALGLALETPLVRALRNHDLDRAAAPVYVQSFEAANLIALRRVQKVKAPLVFLTSGSGGPFGDSRTYADYLTPAGLTELSRWIDGLGPEKSQVLPATPADTPTPLVANAHAAGLNVIPYTFRAENQFLPAHLRAGTDPTAYGRAIDEQVAFWNAGVDGLFTDMPDIGVLARSLVHV
ncbi:glycerophosphodiester phosphodiesterase [Actinoplanes sp. NBRC 103695]|uniref:glycerophosphodiester phosphodiesterase n=1 Tax=Actinoplanes sp. NBRC 103695 TaxID=3032202 RepID=UPI00249FE322|nr:glycerophosphodiester phosphodiesterase [Actinoplanes sp. NBRC 103695]GLY98526.1 glycerophosphoryl diester phosphodiesterase [Actinoplanes sp. NBRC 103695]